MKIGVASVITEQTISVEEYFCTCESLGFESAFLGEHAVIPVEHVTPFPDGGEIPERYKRFPDPFVALAVAAAENQDHQDRHQRLPGAGAASAVAGQGSRQHRLFFQRPLHLRRRRRMAAGGNRNHGRQLQAPMADDGRVSKGRARVVDQGASELLRRIRQIPAGLLLSQANPETLPSDPHRRRRLQRSRAPARCATRSRSATDGCRCISVRSGSRRNWPPLSRCAKKPGAISARSKFPWF